MPHLTKSKFELALECPTKLYYGANPKDYEDQSINDEFLQALAEGGYQVGELAKFLFSNDPKSDSISISELDYATALNKTQEKRSGKIPIVISEAAFQFENLVIRTDIITEDEKTINIYEVKAKSYDEETVFISTILRGPNKGMTKLNKDWSKYLYDVAFQKYVVQKSNPAKKVNAFIVLADKTKETSIDGLNQIFKILRTEGSRVKIEVMNGVTRADLGNIPLKVLNVNEVCEWIYNNPVDINITGAWSFEELVNEYSKSLQENKIIWSTGVTAKCKSCQYRNDNYPVGKKSGFHECWKKLADFKDQNFKDRSSLELWGGNAGARSIVGDALANKKYFISQLDISDFASSKWLAPTTDTLDATQRRVLQIQKSKSNDFNPYLDKEGLKHLFEELKPPYHFIDFETTAVAIPYHKNRRPYEGLAFQYSYHLMSGKGEIEHKNQFISFEKGVFPSYDFLRSLRIDLHDQPGTIFRYHNHENTYLNLIYKQLLKESTTNVSDRDALLEFIQEISSPTSDLSGAWTPKNEMKDLYRYVLDHYYSLFAKGSNSIKDVLPSVINSSKYLQDKYTKPIYGAEIGSLNFKEPHIWIDASKGMDPYKTLPQIFSDVDRIEFELEDKSITEIASGGAAMVAYAYLQFCDMSEEERIRYRDALLRYCELDTMAMVMIWEYWGNEIGRW
jgi:uncharacterized protein YifE (UPF0438 family)